MAAALTIIGSLVMTNALAAAPGAGPNPVFEGISPVRAFDTRDGVGGHPGKLIPAETATFTIAGTNGIPNDATAVVVNVTALNATLQTHLTVWPAGAPRPNASNLNPSSGSPVPNLVTVKLGTGGAISVYNNSGFVDVFGDVVGYFRDHDHDDRYYTEAEVDGLLASRDSTLSALTASQSSLVQSVADLESTRAELGASVSSLATANSTLASTVDSLTNRPPAPVVDFVAALTTPVKPYSTAWSAVPGGSVEVHAPDSASTVVVWFTAQVMNTGIACKTWAQVLLDGAPISNGTLLREDNPRFQTGGSLNGVADITAPGVHTVAVRVGTDNDGCEVGEGHLMAAVIAPS